MRQRRFYRLLVLFLAIVMAAGSFLSRYATQTLRAGHAAISQSSWASGSTGSGVGLHWAFRASAPKRPKTGDWSNQTPPRSARGPQTSRRIKVRVG